MPDRGSHAQLEGRLRSLARSRELWSVHERDPGPGFGESACPRFPGPSRIEVAIRVVASRIDDLLEQYTSIRGCQQSLPAFHEGHRYPMELAVNHAICGKVDSLPVPDCAAFTVHLTGCRLGFPLT